MSDDYTFDGHITIDPPLNFTQIKAARANAYDQVTGSYKGKIPRYLDIAPETFDMKDYLPLTLLIEESTRETDEGTLQIQRATKVVPSRECEGSLRYTMQEQVESLIKLFPERTFKGMVVAVCPENGDAHKIVVQDGVVQSTTGSLYIHFEDNVKIKLSSIV